MKKPGDYFPDERFHPDGGLLPIGVRWCDGCDRAVSDVEVHPHDGDATRKLLYAFRAHMNHDHCDALLLLDEPPADALTALKGFITAIQPKDDDLIEQMRRRGWNVSVHVGNDPAEPTEAEVDRLAFWLYVRFGWNLATAPDGPTKMWNVTLPDEIKMWWLADAREAIAALRKADSDE